MPAACAARSSIFRTLCRSRASKASTSWTGSANFRPGSSPFSLTHASANSSSGSVSEAIGRLWVRPILDAHRELRRKLETTVGNEIEAGEGAARTGRTWTTYASCSPKHTRRDTVWKYMDPSHPDHVAVEPYLRDGLRATYQLLDRQLGEIAQRATRHDNLIFTEHGMQANYRGDHLVIPILERLGLYLRTDAGPQAHVPSAWRAGPTSPQHAARSNTRQRSAPESSRRRKLRRRFGAASSVVAGVARGVSTAYRSKQLSARQRPARARAQRGVVGAGKEYDALLAKIERVSCAGECRHRCASGGSGFQDPRAVSAHGSMSCRIWQYYGAPRRPSAASSRLGSAV